MSDEAHLEGDSGGPFDAVDPKLTVFALANGLDLKKLAATRRLEWYTEGLERGIVIESSGAGTYRVEALAWPFGSDDVRGRAPLGDAVDAAALLSLLSGAIDAANGL